MFTPTQRTSNSSNSKNRCKSEVFCLESLLAETGHYVSSAKCQPSIGVNVGVMGNPPPVMLLDADKLAEKTW